MTPKPVTQVALVRQAGLDVMLQHARRMAPEECCGLLLGTDVQVESAYPAHNVDRSRTRFRVDPADHFAAIRIARARGQLVVGVYHSHPVTPPAPSPTDEREANDNELLYVIVSLAPEELRGFRRVEGRFRQVRLEAAEGWSPSAGG